MSLKTSLNQEHFQPPALEDNEGSQPVEEGVGVQGQQPQQQQQQHEENVPYNRFQEVVHNNQQMQRQIQQYETRMQQLQSQQAAPQQGLGGMQHNTAPQQQQQQQQQSLIDTLKTPEERRHWQNRIAKEGPAAMVELTNRVIEEQGGRMLQEAVGPILQRLAMIEGANVNNVISQYSNSVQDPEFQSYRPLFEGLVRQAGQNNFDITNPQTLDTIRNFASAQYRTQYGSQQNYQAPPAPPITERPQGSQGFNRPQQGFAGGAFSTQDSDFAARFGLEPAAILAARQRTVRSR